MPYIKRELRNELKDDLESLASKIKDEGTLNYVFTMLALRFLQKEGMGYKALNKIDGVFGCAQKEFYRKYAVPYEEIKEKENGSIR